MNKQVRKIEVDHYPEIAEGLKEIFVSNLSNSDTRVSVTIGELSSALNTLIANGYQAGEKLVQYSRNVHRLHLDITLIIENPKNGNFEIVIFEIKKTKRMGLTELSQIYFSF